MKKFRNMIAVMLITVMAMCSAVYAESEAGAVPAEGGEQSVETAAEQNNTETAANEEGASAADTKSDPKQQGTASNSSDGKTKEVKLEENQVNVKQGAEELIFTIAHSKTIDIAIVSPSGANLVVGNDNVTALSINGGTQISVKSPEEGIWTINAKSMENETIRIAGECKYDFIVRLDEYPGTIYTDRAANFRAVVEKKDGTPIDEEVLKKAFVTLCIVKDKSSKPREVSMNYVGGKYEVQYTHKDVEQLYVYVVADLDGAVVKSDQLGVISIPDPDAKGGLPAWIIILIVLVILAAIVILLILFSSNDNMKNKFKKKENMVGTITIVVSDNGVDRMPTTRNLAMLGSSVGMLALIGDDEFYDVNGITLVGSERGIKVINKSKCEIRYSNVGSDPLGTLVTNEQFFRIYMPDGRTVVNATYHSGDIFSGIMNATAEQRRKIEEQIEARKSGEAEIAAQAEAAVKAAMAAALAGYPVTNLPK